MALTYPIGQLREGEFTPNGRKVHDNAVKCVILLQFFDTPFEIVCIGDDAFDLVGAPPSARVCAPYRFVVLRLALRWFEIDDSMDALRNGIERARSIRFEQNSFLAFQELRHELASASLLHHRFAPGDFDQFTPK